MFYLMSQKGIISPLVLVILAIVIMSSFGGFYVAKLKYDTGSKFPLNIQKEIINDSYESNSSFIPQDVKDDTATFSDPEADAIKNITSNTDLPDIAQAVIKYEVGQDKKTIPQIQFVSNDGEYATVNVGQVGYGGGQLDFWLKEIMSGL